MRPRVVLVGATATGKSEVALALGERLAGEILGADSRQIYRGLEVGTGAPSTEARRRVPHHFVSFLPPTETYSAGRYGLEARAAVEAIEGRGRTAVTAGGSGLYIRALIEGLFEGPSADPEIRRRLRRRLETEGLPALRAELHRVDPAATAAILPGDSIRVIRALEVFEATGRPISALRRERARAPLAVRVFGLRWPRALLAARIVERLDRQLAGGFLDECRALLASGIPETAPGPRTLGFRELIEHVRGATSLAEARDRIALRTRQLAKRQETWFRSMAGVSWFEVETERDLDRVPDRILDALRSGAGAARGGGNFES